MRWGRNLSIPKHRLILTTIDRRHIIRYRFTIFCIITIAMLLALTKSFWNMISVYPLYGNALPEDSK